MILSRDAAGKCAHGVMVELRAGRSPIASRRFSAGSGEERVMVGSSADCDWRVIAPAVLAHHVELMWVGDALWVSAATPEAEVWIDGAPVDAWTAIEWDTHILFGGAELAVRGASVHDAQTVIASVEPLAATRPPASARVYREESEDRTLVVVEERGVVAPIVTVVDSMPPQDSTRPPETTVFTDLSSLQRWAQHAEQCVEEPTGTHSRPVPAHSPSPAPATAGPVRPQPTLAAPARPQPAPVAAPPPIANPLTVPPPLLSGQLPGQLSAMAEPARVAVVSDRLAAPPTRSPQATAAKPEPFLSRTFEVLHRVREAIPSQVIIGGAIAIAIVIGLLVLDRVGTKREDAHAAATPIALPTPTAAPIPQVVRSDAPPLDPASLAREEAQAARLVVAGQLDAALPIYERLAAQTTDNQAYAIAAKVLRQQIAARCQSTPGGPGCPAPK